MTETNRDFELSMRKILKDFVSRDKYELEKVYFADRDILELKEAFMHLIGWIGVKFVRGKEEVSISDLQTDLKYLLKESKRITEEE